MTLTPAQRRALAWLPKDGSWRDGSVTNDMASLKYAWPKSVERQRLGVRLHLQDVWRWRLTPLGMERVAAMEVGDE